MGSADVALPGSPGALLAPRLAAAAADLGPVAAPARRQTVGEAVPSKMLEMNLKVFDLGYEKGMEMIHG